MLNRLSTYFYLRPKLVLALFLVPPLVWFLVGLHRLADHPVDQQLLLPGWVYGPGRP